MQTIYQLNANELDYNFLEGLKSDFRDKKIQIIVSEIDETTYLMPYPTHAEERNNQDDQDIDEISEQEWLQAVAHNSAFDFLNDPEEDIYTITDGKPFHG